MERQPGLYVTVHPSGRILKIIVSEKGGITGFGTSIADDLMRYANMMYEPYENLMQHAVWLMEHRDELENCLEADNKVFLIVEELMASLKRNNLTSALLMRLHIKGIGPIVSAPALCEVVDQNLNWITAAHTVLSCALRDLRDGIPIDVEGKYNLIKNYEFTEFTTFDGTQMLHEFYFQIEAGYMIFLLMKFIESKQRVARCHYCGKFFVPKTDRTTLYCDHIVKDGKTCKELAPQEMHKADAANQKVIKEFDRAKQRMYKRYERAGYGKKPSPKDLTREQYLDWLNAATDARDKFLAGELTEEEALAVIVVP